MSHERSKKRPPRERPTVGQLVTANLAARPERYDVRDVQQAAEKNICANLQECVDKNSRIWDHFYIVYLLRYERLLPGTLRGRFIARQSRPDPDWDTSLWEYFVPDQKLLYHWSLPDKESGLLMLANPTKVPDHAQQLFGFVKQFHAGKLI